MKNTKLKLICTSLLCILLIGVLAITTAAGAGVGDGDYTIDEPYAYQVDVDSTEWRSLDVFGRREAFYVPQDIIESMTTEALALTVLSNPFMADMYAFGDVEFGIEWISDYVYGLEELLNRADAYDVLNSLRVNYLAQEVNIDDNKDDYFRCCDAGFLLEYIEKNEVTP